jgi:UDP-N-acetylglucosamine 2-epimerase (non-hydrolysing)
LGRSLLIKRMAASCPKVLTIFGTRPEAIKLAPVIQELERRPFAAQTVNVATSQHEELLRPFIELFGIRVDYNLRAMRRNQRPDHLCARLIKHLTPILIKEEPDLVLVQGDTTTALAGALAASQQGIPIGHVEAGLRSGNTWSPYPEEINRRLITQLASYHFAATELNRASLLAEGVDERAIFITGNPVVDSLKNILSRGVPALAVERILSRTRGLKRIVLTTHRRESFGQAMLENLSALRRFVESHADVALVFPVHPNPFVVEAAKALEGHPRIHIIEPLGYEEFIQLLAQVWLIVSDSGGVQEEAPTLGRPLLILRENTERPEAVASGVARLVGGSTHRLASLLEEAYREESWANRISEVSNPFGDGSSGRRICETLLALLGAEERMLPALAASSVL